MDVFKEIQAERKIQDAQWGGLVHDDKHNPDDWLKFIEAQISKTRSAHANVVIGDKEFRKRMVKIAALAVAGIESSDRLSERVYR